MKKVYHLLIILFTVSFGKAQNWQTVYSDRIQYFDSGANAIKIIAKQVDSNGDSIFFNYPSLYLDEHGKIPYNWQYSDSSSWIGKRLIIKPNGINGFIHTLNDTCIVKTKAEENESWSFIENDSVLVTATIDSVRLNTHYGFTDSIKYMRLSVIKTPNNQWKSYFLFLDNKQIWLSKNNGLLVFPTLEFNLFYNHFSNYYNVKPIYTQTKINLFTNKNLFDFEVGDIIHSEEYSNHLYTGGSVYNGYSKRWYIDSYIDKKYDPVGDSVQYKINRRHFFLISRRNPDTTYVVNDSKTIITQTYYNLSQQAFGILPYSLSPIITSLLNSSGGYGDGTPTEFIIKNRNNNGYCNNTLIVNQQQSFFESWFTIGFTSRQGFSSLSQDGSNGAFPSNPLTTRNSIVYVKNSCGESGTNITLSINTIKNNKGSIKVYPNPANDILLVEGGKFKSIQITDISGKTVYYKTFDHDVDHELINVSAFQNGVYLVRTQTINGFNVNKVLVQH